MPWCLQQVAAKTAVSTILIPPLPLPQQAKKPVVAAAKRRSPAKAGGPLKSPLKRMQGGAATKQAGKKRGREAAAAAAELQVGLGRTTVKKLTLRLVHLSCRGAGGRQGGASPQTTAAGDQLVPSLPCPVCLPFPLASEGGGDTGRHPCC